MRLNLMVCVPVDGFLRNPDRSLNEEALVLAQGLASNQRLAVLLDDSDPIPDERWLKTAGLIEYTLLVPGKAGQNTPIRRLTQVNMLRAQRYNISYVLESDPVVVQILYTYSIPALLFLHPQFARPEARPDYHLKPRPWDDLLQEIEKQRAMRADQEREEAVI